MSGTQHAGKKTGPARGGASSSAPKDALERDTAGKSAGKSEKQRQDELLDKALMDSFPGSDPVALTEPGKPGAAPPKKTEK